MIMERGLWKSSADVSPACPRCGSANTKFCYYNNYSLTQPRYFCKGCRRYWTKGGSLRNVPIGGGCRKSRRGKSVGRAASDGGVGSRSSAHGGVESSSSFSVGQANIGSTSTSIDLAAVYANFLNQPARPQNRVEPPVSEMHDRSHVSVNVIPSVEFPNFQGSHIMDHLGPPLPAHQSSPFLECGPFSWPLLGNSMFFGGPDNGFQKQGITGNSFVMNPMDDNSLLLPPLPGHEDGAASGQGMLWPGADMVFPGQVLDPTREENGTVDNEAGRRNSEVLSGEMSQFSALNLEAIFRS